METQTIEINPLQWKLLGYGKFRAAQQLHRRGNQFLIAAIHIDEQYSEDGYVVRHLLCQGLELVLKALLLLKDYDKYEPLLHKPKHFGHNLMALTNEVCDLYEVKLRAKHLADLARLNHFFQAHLFRYAHHMEMDFSPAHTFPIRQLRFRILSLLNLADPLFRPKA